jgi:hypothetical protein
MWLLLALACGPLTIVSRWDPPADLLNAGPPLFAQAFRLANQTRSTRAWFTASAAWDSVTIWPRGQVIEIETRDGRTLQSVSILAMTPRPLMLPIRLGEGDRELNPSSLEHRRGQGVVLLVSFPDPTLGRRDIADVRIRQRHPRAAAPAANGGPP